MLVRDMWCFIVSILFKKCQRETTSLLGSRHGCSNLWEEELHEYERMFMQQVKLNDINEQIKDVNHSKMKYECFSVLKTSPKLLLVDADLYKEICYSPV